MSWSLRLQTNRKPGWKFAKLFQSVSICAKQDVVLPGSLDKHSNCLHTYNFGGRGMAHFPHTRNTRNFINLNRSKRRGGFSGARAFVFVRTWQRFMADFRLHFARHILRLCYNYSTRGVNMAWRMHLCTRSGFEFIFGLMVQSAWNVFKLSFGEKSIFASKKTQWNFILLRCFQLNILHTF